jgi:hypothetical protein
MAYDVPDIEEYSWAQDATFGSTGVTHFITGPRGKVGFVRDISVDVTTSMAGTLVPEIDIGLSSGDSTFGRYRLGTTASTGYPVGMHRASEELWTGNPPRTLADFAGHVILDAGPYSTGGSVVGGSSTTQNPVGRIPAGGFTVTNVVNGTGNVPRISLLQPVSQLTVGQGVWVQGVAGATGTNSTTIPVVISAISTSGNYIETSGTFGGTYTSGGIVLIAIWVTCLAGTGTSAGGGYVRVKIQWVGANIP